MSNNLRSSRIFFTLLFVLVVYLFFQMMKPFLVTIILALTLVTLFYPNYLVLERKLKGRSNLSAMIMCSVVTFLIILPALLFFSALFAELNDTYRSFRAQLAAPAPSPSSPWPENEMVRELLDRLRSYLGAEGVNLSSLLATLIDRMLRYVLDHYSIILGGIGVFFLKFFIMIFSTFFFFRDGHALLRELKNLIPLETAYQDLVVAKLREVTYAVFFGIFATGICQGVAAGLIFFFLGVQNPILWGTATAFFSLVPIVGTAAVWVPMSVHLILAGKMTQGILLLVLGSTVIGVVDNFVRPLIIEGKAKGLHMLLVFFSLLGGLGLFGPAGLVLGPLVASLLVTFLEIYKKEFRAG